MSTIGRIMDISGRVAAKVAAHPLRTGGAVLAADLLSKSASGQLPLSTPPLNAHQYCLVQSALCIEHLKNANGAFNTHLEWNAPMKLIYIAGTLCLAGLFTKVGSKMTKLALALVIAGKVSNQFERFAWGQITDFIKLGSWPNFNLADASITAGLALITYKAIVGIKNYCASRLSPF